MAIVIEDLAGGTMLDQVWLGSEVKLAVSITAEGFDMMRDDFRIVIHGGMGNIEVPREGLLINESGEWILGIDTNALGAGKVTMVTYAEVPDSDFPDGVRTEVDKTEIFTIKAV